MIPWQGSRRGIREIREIREFRGIQEEQSERIRIMQKEAESGRKQGGSAGSDHWAKVAVAIKGAGVTERVREDLPPPGMVTRIVARAQADGRADELGLLRWRRWAVAGAGAAMAVLAISFYTVPVGDRDSQFMPVPRLELLQELAE